jgi:pimeloyl-ACP methyl ester carboxylesterase
LKFQRQGPADGTQSVVLIPGMGCGGSVWDRTAEALRDRYVVYTVTLAGFDGVPPLKPPLGETWARGVVALMEQEKLQRPVIVGHSLGVSVAVRVAALAPGRVGALVAVDGTPVFPVPEEGQTAEQRKLASDAIAAAMRAVPAGTWEAVLRTYIRPMAKERTNVERVVQMCLRSDRESIIESSRELANDDLRQELRRLESVPVTAIIAVPGPATPGETPQRLQAELETFYRRGFDGTRRLTLRYVQCSGHMVMYDQPEAFHRELQAALDSTAGS